MVTRN